MNLVVGISKSVALDFFFIFPRIVQINARVFMHYRDDYNDSQSNHVMVLTHIHTDQNFRLYFLGHKTCSDKVLWSPQIFVPAGRYFFSKLRLSEFLYLGISG